MNRAHDSDQIFRQRPDERLFERTGSVIDAHGHQLRRHRAEVLSSLGATDEKGLARRYERRQPLGRPVLAGSRLPLDDRPVLLTRPAFADAEVAGDELPQRETSFVQTLVENVSALRLAKLAINVPESGLLQPSLLAILEASDDPQVRWMALEVAAHLGDRSSMQRLLDTAVTPGEDASDFRQVLAEIETVLSVPTANGE